MQRKQKEMSDVLFESTTMYYTMKTECWYISEEDSKESRFKMLQKIESFLN